MPRGQLKGHWTISVWTQHNQWIPESDSADPTAETYWPWKRREGVCSAWGCASLCDYMLYDSWICIIHIDVGGWAYRVDRSSAEGVVEPGNLWDPFQLGVIKIKDCSWKRHWLPLITLAFVSTKRASGRFLPLKTKSQHSEICQGHHEASEGNSQALKSQDPNEQTSQDF